MNTDKQQVHNFWNKASCGENLYLTQESKEGYEAQAEKRYELEPYILTFADFKNARGKKFLKSVLDLGQTTSNSLPQVRNCMVLT